MTLYKKATVSVVAALLAATAQASYTVTIVPSSPVALHFTLEVPDHHGNVLATRRTAFVPETQVVGPSCGAQKLELIGPGRWRVPAACRKVDWTIDFVTQPVDVSAQRNVALPHGWLISEQAALLRVEGDSAASLLTIKTSGQADRLAYVPSTDEAPEFYAVGDWQEAVRTVDGVKVRYVSDDLEAVRRRGFLDFHARALAALRRLYPATDTGLLSAELTVVLLKSPEDGKLAGAGGARSLLVNYPHGASRDILAWATMAHEQFHQIQALHAHGEASSWLNEGLAHYYGLKMMERSDEKVGEKSKVWSKFIDTHRPVDAGLAELSRRFSAGDKSVYPLFYSQGATFFAELDRALEAGSHGKKSLDDFVPMLRTTPDGILPDDVLAALRAAAGPRMDELVARYVGR
jgi:hypothetical protein